MILGAETRSNVRRDHALIAPDSHVESPLLGWRETQGVVLISPALGARFSQYLALMEKGGAAALPSPGVQRALYVLEGEVEISAATQSAVLGVGGYAYLPAGEPHDLVAREASRVHVFEKPFRLDPSGGRPAVVIGHQEEVEGEPFLGDEDALLKPLLPAEAPYDMAMNLFTFQPGAALPFVEVHVMEHGLMMVAGQGIYRLEDSWYPVREGDAIWMASYCPQWFAAHGKTPAAYLYYKDIHRDPLESLLEGAAGAELPSTP